MHFHVNYVSEDWTIYRTFVSVNEKTLDWRKMHFISNLYQQLNEKIRVKWRSLESLINQEFICEFSDITLKFTSILRALREFHRGFFLQIAIL